MARPEIESSVQMRLYTLTKRQFIVVFLVFAFAFALFLCIGIAGPAVMHEEKLNATCKTKSTPLAKCSAFSMPTPMLTSYNQQVWIVSSVTVARKSAGELDNSQMFNISVDLEEVFDKDAPPSSWGKEGKLPHNRKRVMVCHGDGSCNDIVVLHLGYLSAPVYRFKVRFVGLPPSQSKQIKKIEFIMKTYNSSFTELDIWIRVIFLFLTFLSGCWFVQVMKKFSFRDWCLEQRFMALLLPLLLLYNNPLFPMNFLTSSWLPGALDGFFQVTFLCSLLLFWICLYHGIRVNERRFLPFYFPKFVIVGLLWLAAFTLSTWKVSNSLHDPTYSTAVDSGNFLGVKVFFFIVGSVYVLYLLYLLVRAFAELRSLPYFDLRLRFLTLLGIFVLAVSVAVFVLRFGTSVLQDNFVAELSFTYKNSAEFLTFYSLLNLYVYLMSYVYSPSKNAVYETHFRDNPTMSMLNDTDDDDDDDENSDVIFDEEDLKKKRYHGKTGYGGGGGGGRSGGGHDGAGRSKSGGRIFVEDKNRNNKKRDGKLGGGGGGKVDKKLINHDQSDDAEDDLFNMATPF